MEKDYNMPSKFIRYYDRWKTLYINGMSCTEIARKYKCSDSVVNRFIRSAGISRCRSEINRILRSKLEVKECHRYFDTIDSEDKSYWLGMLLADGYMRSSKNGEGGLIEFALKESDGYMVEKFAKMFNANTRVKPHIRGDNTFYSIDVNVCSRHMFNRLVELGILPRKSYSNDTRIFDNIPQGYMNHFIRGIFDGDGSIYTLNRRGNPTCISFNGTPGIIQRISYNISLIGIKCANAHPDYRSVMGCRIAWGSRIDVTNIIHYLYDDATIYLDRKYQKAMDILAMYDNKDTVSTG